MNSTGLTPQRWERPFNFPPGYWKRQLPARVLDLAHRGDIAALRQLLAEHPDYLNKKGSHNRTLLWTAVRHGKLATVQWLVEQGADVNSTGCHNGESYVQLTPYCAALYYRRHAIADYLRPLTAPPDIFRAAFLGEPLTELDAHPELLHADDPYDDIYFVPLLAFAIVGGHLHTVNDLLQRGAIVAPYSAQLLSLAARDARLDIIERLVAHGAEIPALDPGSFVLVSDLAIMKYLLDRGASAARPGKNRFPPLVYLTRGDKGEHPEKIEMLLEYGALINAPGPGKRTALHYAAAAGFLRVIDLLVAHGVNLTLRDEDGQTALDVARKSGKDAAAALLIQHGAKS